MDPTLHNALGAAAALISIAFCLLTFERWQESKAKHQAAWSVSLALFASAAWVFWLATAIGWNDSLFRLFYYFGAIANVPVLALGTIYLLSSDRLALVSARVVTTLLLFAAGVLAVAPISGDVASAELPKGADHFEALPRILAAFTSSIGALVVFGGAAWSAKRLFGSKATRQLGVANLFIAAGAAVLSASGLFNARLGELKAFSVTLLIGITLIFLGFLFAGSKSASSTNSQP